MLVITFNKDFTVLVSNPQADKLFQKWYANNVDKNSKHLPPEIYQMLEHVFDVRRGIRRRIRYPRYPIFCFY